MEIDIPRRKRNRGFLMSAIWPFSMRVGIVFMIDTFLIVGNMLALRFR